MRNCSAIPGARRPGRQTRRAPRSGPWRKDDQHDPARRARGAPSRGIARAIHAQVVGPAPVPAPPDFPAQAKPTLVKRADILEYKALASYSEPAWVTEKFVDDRQAAAGRRAAAEGADGLQDRQHARRPRRLRRRDAPRDRRPARGLELHGRADPGLGRHRHRHLRMPDPHRAAVHGRAGGPRAAAEPREELGLVGGRQGADHPPDRGRQVVGRRSVRRRGRDVLLGRSRRRSRADAAERRLARDLRRRHDAREGRRLHGEVHLHPGLPRAGALRARLRHVLPGAEPRDEAAAPEVLGQHLRAVHQRLPADLHELPGDGRLGAGRVPARRHHRAAPQPLLLEGRRDRAAAALPRRDALPALDLGRPRRAGGGRHRRLLEPRAAGELRRVAAPRRRSERAGAPRVRAADHRLLDVPELLGQRLGRARRARPGDPRAQPRPQLPHGGQPRDRPAAARQLAGQGPVHRDLPGRHGRRLDLLRRREHGLLSLLGRDAPRRCSRRRG